MSVRRLGAILLTALVACGAPKETAPPAKSPPAVAASPAGATEEPEEPKEPPDDPPSREAPWRPEARPRSAASIEALLALVEQWETIDLIDEWGGLGSPYKLHIVLQRNGHEVAYRARAERLHFAKAVEKSGTTTTAFIETFLRRLAQRRVDNVQAYAEGPAWTDDNPHVSMLVKSSKISAPLALYYEDNQRHWKANGFFITPDTPLEGEPVDNDSHTRRKPRQARLNGSYWRMLWLLGAYEWLDEVGKSR